MKKVRFLGFFWTAFLWMVFINTAFSLPVSDVSSDTTAIEPQTSEQATLSGIPVGFGSISEESWESVTDPGITHAVRENEAVDYPEGFSEESWGVMPVKTPSEPDMASEIVRKMADVDEDPHETSPESSIAEADKTDASVPLENDDTKNRVQLSDTAPTKPEKGKENTETSVEKTEEIGEASSETQTTAAEISLPEEQTDAVEPIEDIREERWPIPADLEAEYQAVTGENTVGNLDVEKFDIQEQAEKPPFEVFLPGADNAPGAPYSPDDQPDTLLNGEAPLYEGGEIVRNEVFGNNYSIEIIVPATPEEIFDYYKAEMTAKGWLGGISMKQKERGLLFFSKEEKELVFRIEKKGQGSMVTINLVGKENFRSRRNR